VYGYPPAYGYGGYGYGYGNRGGNSCLRDACLVETGCCLAEGMDGGCLVAAVLLGPQLLGATRAGFRTGGGAAGLIRAIRVYQREISPRRRPVCRFTPSCSEYTAQALRIHGVSRGLALGARRLLRCRPGGNSGHDPVPGAA
jgi:putative membrane protein insertion efficiency factor